MVRSGAAAPVWRDWTPVHTLRAAGSTPNSLGVLQQQDLLATCTLMIEAGVAACTTASSEQLTMPQRHIPTAPEQLTLMQLCWY